MHPYWSTADGNIILEIYVHTLDDVYMYVNTGDHYESGSRKDTSCQSVI